MNMHRSLTSQVACTSFSMQLHKKDWDHQQTWKLASLVSLGPGTQMQPLAMHQLFLLANRNA